MAIEKLNFSGKNFNPTIGKSTSELLIGYGNILNDKRDNEIALKQKEEAIRYQRSRDALIDSRYEADRKERLDDKFDAKHKASMTNEALALIGNKDAFLSGKISAENKAYADALAQISDPVERARLEQDIKSYQASGQQKQGWIDSTLGQSNIDNSKILDLKRDMEKEAENKRRFDLQLAETRAIRNERAQEKLDAKKALNEMYARSMTPDSNISPDGLRYKEKEEKTGNKTIPNYVSIPDSEGIEELKKMKIISDKIDALASKNKINYENRVEAFKVYKEENPDAANSSEAGKVVDRAFEGAVKNVSDGMINGMSLPGKILAVGLDKAKPLFMTDIEREEYNKKLDEAKAKEAQESLKSDSPGEKAKPGNISFDDYWKLKKDQQALDNAELKKLQKELEDTGYKYYNNAANTYGVDETKTVKIAMTPEEARNDAALKTANVLTQKGVAPEYVLKYAYENGEKAYNLQASLISNANKEGKESAKNKLENVEKAKKKIEEEIKELRKLKNKIGTGGEDKVWYGSELLPIPRAQEEIDNDISELNRKIDNLK